MSPADASARARRRARRAHELRDEGWSQRKIARELRVSLSTVNGYLHAPVPEGQAVANLHAEDGRPVAGAEPLNGRALKHGMHSPRELAPLIAKHAGDLRSDYPFIADRLCALQAQRLAQIDLGTAWLIEKRTIVKNDEGDVYRVAEYVEKVTLAAERTERELQAEARTRANQPRGSLAELSEEFAEHEAEAEGAQGDDAEETPA